MRQHSHLMADEYRELFVGWLKRRLINTVFVKNDRHINFKVLVNDYGSNMKVKMITNEIRKIWKFFLTFYGYVLYTYYTKDS